MADTVAVFTHPACVAHDPGPGHPEAPDRLSVLLESCRRRDWLSVTNQPTAAGAGREMLERVHPPDYLDFLQQFSERGGGAINPDTAMNAKTWEAILGATGALDAAVDHAVAGRGHAFAAVRPPGHHALAHQAMGFCFVGNVVVAARSAQARGLGPILIVDWDVHHGNGTQALVEHDPTVRFVSLHQWPWYPGTGAADDRGVGNIFNVPRPPGLAPEQYVEDFWTGIQAALLGWKPELVLVSAGFDAMAGDPLGGFTFEPEHYAEITKRLRVALTGIPIVGTLEGGYIPERLTQGAVAYLEALR